MSRRTGTEKTFDVTLLSVIAGSGAMVLVAPDADTILSAKIAQVSAEGSGNFEYNILAGNDIILHGHVPEYSSITFDWPDSYEAPKGSGLYIEALENDGSITLYYTPYDESAGITKLASRTASLNPPLATRTPNNVKGRVKT